MREISIRYISKEDASDINIKNESFEIFGRMLPSYQDGEWSYTISRNSELECQVFPDEHYDFDAMKDEYIFVGAYDGPACVGLAILKHQWNRYLYLHDLKVGRAYRGQHIATKMVETACEYAKAHGYRGIWTIGQDNNLAACLFYINTDFRIGGLDTEVYTGTKQAGKSDIHFYRDVR